MASSKRSVLSRVGGDSPTARVLMLILLIAGWAFVFASLIGFDPADPPTHVVYPPNPVVVNWCGPFGAVIAATLFKVLGFGAWVLTIFTGIGLLSAAMGQGLKHWAVRLLGLLLLSVGVASVQALLLPGSGPLADLSGGLVGKMVSAELLARFGVVGSTLLLVLGMLVGLIVAMDEWLFALLTWAGEKTREHGVPAAKVVGAATGELALAAGSRAADATSRAGTSLFQGLMERLRPAKKSKRKGKTAPKLDDLEGETPGKVAEEDEGESETIDPVTGEVVPVAKRVKKGKGKETPAATLTPATRATLEKASVTTREEDEEADDAAQINPADNDSLALNGGGDADAEEGEDDETPSAPQVYSEDQLREKIARLPIVFGQRSKSSATDADLANLQIIEEGEKYRFPGLDLLEEPEANFSERLEETVKEQAAALIQALQQFKIDGQVDSIESGPVITLFHVRLSPGTKVSALEAVSKDIARVLKAQNIRIVSNMAGRDTVGIEVPNLHKEKVRLKELMGKSERFSKMALPTFLGKDASGEPLIEDLAKMPHMLIAGTTGSGKSVCMNTIIMGFLYTKKPSELKLVLVDPKMVEMSQFKDIPHLMCPVVTEMGKAAAILEWATVKMDERYELLAEAGCRDIAAYNELTWDELKERLGVASPEEEAKIPRKLPYMVFIIDELADLMMTNKEVESFIIRIAQKARAVGIHLILATQRPQANVVTGLIKSNMPCRVAFKVASGMDSRIVLDQKGGEVLLGHGDMLFLSPRSSKLTRAQGTLVDDREIRRVVKFMKEVATPSFERSLIQLKSGNADEQRIQDSANNSSASLQAAQEDPLFNRAVEIVLETRRGSVSLLQRRLAIGYTRASRLIDLMGIAGLISDHKGSQARDVLITIEDWDKIKELAAAEAQSKGIDYAKLISGELPAPGAGAPTTDALFDEDDGPSRTGDMPSDVLEARKRAGETNDDPDGLDLPDDQDEGDDDDSGSARGGRAPFVPTR